MNNLIIAIGFFIFMLVLIPLVLFGLLFSVIGIFILLVIVLLIIFFIFNKKKANVIQVNNNLEAEPKKNISKKDLFEKPVRVFFSSSLILGIIILIWTLFENSLEFFPIIFVFWAVPLAIILTFLTFLTYAIKYFNDSSTKINSNLEKNDKPKSNYFKILVTFISLFLLITISGYLLSIKFRSIGVILFYYGWLFALFLTIFLELSKKYNLCKYFKISK